MNIKLASQDTIDQINEWEVAIRAAWPYSLQYLDAANIWSDEQLSLIFRPKGVTNQHRDTCWFLITLATERVQQFSMQVSLHQAIRPTSGALQTFWHYKQQWIVLPTTRYSFEYRYDRRTRQLVNYAR